MSSGDSDSSSSENDAVYQLDEFGRPFSRPAYTSVRQSSVLSRVREFLPQFKASVVKSFDPKIENPDTDSSILLQRPRSCSGSSSYSAESNSSFGVEIEVGCGVFDVCGEVDERALSREGIPTLELNFSTTSHSNHGDMVTAQPLIQEIEKD